MKHYTACRIAALSMIVLAILSHLPAAIGACRLVRSTPHTTSRIRLRITKAAACPALSEIALFAEPAPASPR
ncbi:MAG: hypothetical protein ACYC6N_02615 [Pirellulaceae bacterium]